MGVPLHHRLKWPCNARARQYYSQTFAKEDWTKEIEVPVALFWDVDNKPSRSLPPYNAAARVKILARLFGRLTASIAFASRNCLSNFPPSALHPRASFEPSWAYGHPVSRKKHKLEPQISKNLSQSQNQLTMLHKKSASQLGLKNCSINYVLKIFVPEISKTVLAQELQRAGIWVRPVSDEYMAADRALEKCIMQAIEGGVRCFFLVSDKPYFIDVLKEAKKRGIRSVVVGDGYRRYLKPFADASFPWNNIVNRQAFTRVKYVKGLWMDEEALKKLEWSPEQDRFVNDMAAAEENEIPDKTQMSLGDEDNDHYLEGFSKSSHVHDFNKSNFLESPEYKAVSTLENLKDSRPWWKLPPELEGTILPSKLEREVVSKDSKKHNGKIYKEIHLQNNIKIRYVANP